jgi:hypothetical protein
MILNVYDLLVAIQDELVDMPVQVRYETHATARIEAVKVVQTPAGPVLEIIAENP